MHIVNERCNKRAKLSLAFRIRMKVSRQLATESLRNGILSCGNPVAVRVSETQVLRRQPCSVWVQKYSGYQKSQWNGCKVPGCCLRIPKGQCSRSGVQNHVVIMLQNLDESCQDSMRYMDASNIMVPVAAYTGLAANEGESIFFFFSIMFFFFKIFFRTLPTIIKQDLRPREHCVNCHNLSAVIF